MLSSEGTDVGRGNPGNISRMKEDLEKKIEVPLSSMLKALLAKPQAVDPDDVGEARKKGGDKFDKILSDAIGFCNADVSNKCSSQTERCSRMKERLREFLDPRDEIASYYPLAVFLNQALVYNWEDRDEGVLFVPNDRIILESSELKTDSPKAKRKPDLVAVYASHIRTWKDTWQDDNLGSSETEIGKGTDTKKSQKKGPTWLDVLASLEVKRENQERDLTPLGEVYTFERLSETSEETEAADTGVGAERKRTTPAASHSTATKKQKSTPDLLDLTVTPEVQRGYYGLERLRCAWDATHGFVLLIQGSELELQWYDPQGLIRTRPVDLVRHLPFVVAMLFVFRDFDCRMWGIPAPRLSGVFGGASREFQLSASTPPGLYWIGRRTYTADVKWNNNNASTCSEGAEAGSSANTPNTRASLKQPPTPVAPEKGTFFKASWPEVSREKEPHIVQEARERSERYLGDYKAYTMEHIPAIMGSDELKHTSTAIIRKLLDVHEDLLKPARVLLWMVSKKLDPITELEPALFWTAFREIVRCHYLLWRIGVAHGDVSLRNLMYDPVSKKGILNDYDLSALMRPGDASHTPKGWQRTGTIPFMALELLRNHGGTIQRRYRHDLESFAWCLFWHCSVMTEAHMLARCDSFDQALKDKNYILTTGLVGENPEQSLISHWGILDLWMESWKEEWDKLNVLQKRLAKGLPVPAAVDPDEDKKYIVQCWYTFHQQDLIAANPSWLKFRVGDDMHVSSGPS